MKKIKQYIEMKFDRGQVVLILVLITVVGLTIGLSLISRTITDIRISSQIEQSSRAFSAAEAGIETALRGNIAVGPTGTVDLPGASANYSVINQGGEAQAYTLPLTEVGNTQTVWLIEHNNDGTLNEDADSYPVTEPLEVCWGLQEGQTPAILVTLYYKVSTEYKIAKKAYSPDTVRDENFEAADVTGPYCGDYKYRKIVMPSTDADPTSDDIGIDPLSKLLLLRIQSLVDPTTMTVVPTDPLPVQGKIITSIGRTSTGIVRKIQVSQGFQVLPGLLDFAFYSEE